MKRRRAIFMFCQRVIIRFRQLVSVGLLAVVLLVFINDQPQASFFGPSDFSECILKEMPGVQNVIAAREVRNLCANRFPTDDVDLKAAERRGPNEKSRECVINNSRNTSVRFAVGMIYRACLNLKGTPPPPPPSNIVDNKDDLYFGRFIADKDPFCLKKRALGSKQNLKIFQFDKTWEAAFPSQPSQPEEFVSKPYSFRGYSYFDDCLTIRYVAGHQVNVVRFSTSDIAEAMENFVKGNALVLNGHVAEIIVTQLGKNFYQTDYELSFMQYDLNARKFGRNIYKDGKIYFWSVQGFTGMSSVSAKSIFAAHAVRMKLLD